MAQIPGSVPLTGKVAPTDTTDTFATHVDIYGEGGYMTVADQTEREAITTERRKQGMAVFQNDTNKMYILQGGIANTNWTEFTGGSSLAIENAGTQLTAAAAKINFTGAGVTATNSGADVTVTIPGGGGNPDMQDVFNNSTPNVTAIDASKKLSLSAGDVDILTDVVGGGSSQIVVQTSDSASGQLAELTINPSLTTLRTENLDVEVSTSNGPDVGDVLMAESVNSNYGRLRYNPGVQIARPQISQTQLRNLFTTPVTLINGIGGRYIMILEVYVALQSATVGYNAGVKLQIVNTTYGIPILETNEFLQSTSGGTRVFYPMDPATIGPNDRPVSSSSGWRLECTADPGTSGTGNLDMFITYMVIP